MAVEGHLLLSITCVVFTGNAEPMPMLAQGDWWYTAPSAILACLLPDINHPRSLLGQRLRQISKPIARAFGRRGFTYNLLAVFVLLATFYLKVPKSQFIPTGTLQDVMLGYLSHILADALTPTGVPLPWSCRWRFHLPILVPQKGNQLKRFICVVLFVWSVWMPHSLPESGAVCWSLQMIDALQTQFHRLIKYQVEY